MSGNIAGSAQTQWIDPTEGRIAYDTVGTGPLVICVPGMGELRSVYRRTVPALAAAGYRAVTIDLRGHGDSDATFSSYDDVAAGGDILALIEHLRGPAGAGESAIWMGAGGDIPALPVRWGGRGRWRVIWRGAGPVGRTAAAGPVWFPGVVGGGAFGRSPPMNPLLALAFRAAMAGPWAP